MSAANCQLKKMEIYTFDKSLQERLTEFTNILSNRGDVVPASQIRAEWAYHTELILEPVGWQGLWKIPRLTCQDFQIHYPTIVAVEVENVDFSELSALVKIVAVQDDIHLPDKYDVPLLELYPTKEQENTALDVVSTAECIDQLRFFYNYLWMPWDTDDDETIDWVANHLETRLRLFFDMKRGDMCKKTCDMIRTLMREGRDIQARIAKLEMEISDDEDESEKVLDDNRACQLMKLHFRLQQIKTEMEVYENPAMREMLVRNQSFTGNEVEIKRRESRGRQLEAHFVWLGGSLEETIEALKSTQDFLPSNTFTKTSNCLQEALDISDKGDIVIIGKGEHEISGAGNLEEGGTLKGLSKAESIIVCPKETESGPSLLDFSGAEVLLENITVDLRDLQAGILIRKGLVKLTNCRIVVDNQSVIKLGVVVLPGARLIAKNTYFTGLGTCVVVHTSAEAVLSDCTFDDCVEGIQLNNKSKLSASNCSFTNCKEYAIRKETEDLNNSEAQIGDVDILQNASEILIQDCRFENNLKGNINLKPCSNMILPVKQENMIIS
ncbi:protein nessun dorma isoform X1 [Nasonia vitripennis]|uniref:Uncharacterized protein n=2 Tax=Nasonia vitripennis TaxID=7425 RepID=A0A7M7LV71_NASVI|nr:protein nessun dorma isoform X1 [Nasonia vitripennis]